MGSVGVGSGSTVGVGSGSTVGVGSGSTVGVGPGSTVGVGIGSTVGDGIARSCMGILAIISVIGGGGVKGTDSPTGKALIIGSGMP
jgi:hypothetical protein